MDPEASWQLPVIITDPPERTNPREPHARIHCAGADANVVGWQPRPLPHTFDSPTNVVREVILKKLGRPGVRQHRAPAHLKENGPVPPPMMSPANAWRILCRRTGGEISRGTFYRWLSSGKVYAIRLGFRILVPWPSLEELIKKCLAGERF